MYNKIEFTFLHDYDSLKSGIISLLKITPSMIRKKGQLSPSVLKKKIKKKSTYSLDIDLINSNKINPEYCGKEVSILFEDQHFLCLNKPTGVHSHPLSYADKNNILSFLRYQNHFSPLMINLKRYDRGLLYRLDFQTSGVLVLTKDQKLYSHIRRNYRQVVEKKIYQAIVSGQFKQDGQHEYTNQEGRKGSLIVKRKGYNSDKQLSLLEIELLTGLRHQIRQQLSLLGHPIIGDTSYGGQKAQRIFLHAYLYQMNISTQKYVFTIPSDFIL